MKKIILDKEILREQLSLGIKKEECAKNLGISKAVFLKLCKENNLPLVRYKNLNSQPKTRPDIDKQWLIDNWVNTDKSMSQLAKENNVSEGLIDSRRAKYSLKKAYKFHVNTKKLFNLKDPNVYYLAGLLATDGYFPRNLNCFELQLSGASEYILLNKIRDYFEITSPIEEYITYAKKAYRLRVACDGLNNFFENNFNIKSGAKTFNVGIPTFFYNEECAKAFVRGCCDGDGYIGKKPGVFALTTGSKELVYGLYKIILKYTGIDTNFKNHKYYSISLGYQTTNKAFKFLSWIYSQNNALYLERKYEIFKEIYKDKL